MQGVKRSFYVSTLISIGATILLTTFSMLFCRQILEIMQTPPEIIGYAYEYLMVIFAGIFAQIAFNLLSNNYSSHWRCNYAAIFFSFILYFKYIVRLCIYCSF